MSTLAGSFLHGTHVDAATITALTPTVTKTQATSSERLSSDLHPHVERVHGPSKSKGDARITPRESKYRKFLMQNRVPRGEQDFDGYYLPTA